MTTTDDQTRMDYYLRVMDRLLDVGEALHAHGPDGLEAAAPWAFGGCGEGVAADGPAEPESPRGARRAPRLSERPFPRRWPALAQAIRHARSRYTRVDGRNIKLIRGASRNIPFLPGIAINEQSFRADEATAIGEIVHEALHDPGFGILGTGLGHRAMKDLVPTILPADDPAGDAFSQYVDFLIASRTGDGRSFWSALLESAGPRPAPAAAADTPPRAISAGWVGAYLAAHAAVVAVCVLFFLSETGRRPIGRPLAGPVETVAALSLALIPITPVVGILVVRWERSRGRKVPWRGLFDLALTGLHLAAVAPGYL